MVDKNKASRYAQVTGTKAQQIAGTIEKLISGGGKSEKVIFRRFPGVALARAIKNNQTLSDKDVDKVILRINPQQVAFDKKKIISKIQTSAPGRFVVYDWGTDLTVVTINGNTGNLLPEFIINGGTDPLFPFQNDMVEMSGMGTLQGDNLAVRAKGNSLLGKGAGVAAASIANLLMGSSSYMELLAMSPKYQVFKKLENMFEIADADRDIIIMEFGDYGIFRGYFENFKFSIVAETPWNWKYDLTFIILTDLSKAEQRGDDTFPDNDFLG